MLEERQDEEEVMENFLKREREAVEYLEEPKHSGEGGKPS
jgi:hypothetical protein